MRDGENAGCRIDADSHNFKFPPHSHHIEKGSNNVLSNQNEHDANSSEEANLLDSDEELNDLRSSYGHIAIEDQETGPNWAVCNSSATHERQISYQLLCYVFARSGQTMFTGYSDNYDIMTCVLFTAFIIE